MQRTQQRFLCGGEQTVAVSYRGPAIFLVEAPDIQAHGASDEIDRSEIVKLRHQTLPPRLLIRLGSRSETVMPQQGQLNCKLLRRLLLSVKA